MKKIFSIALLLVLFGCSESDIKRLQEEQKELNNLVGTYMLARNDEIMRKMILQDIDSKFPDFLNGFLYLESLESACPEGGGIITIDMCADVQDLENRLVKANEQYDEMILATQKQEQR